MSGEDDSGTFAVYEDSTKSSSKLTPAEKEQLQTAVIGSIARQCIREGIIDREDPRLPYVVERYHEKCPGLRVDMVERKIDELLASVNKQTNDDGKKSSLVNGNNNEQSSSSSPECCKSTKFSGNGGFNLITYTCLLLFFSVLMFIISIIMTATEYNRVAYRDWALAGGVTSTSAEFRVRGPQTDDNLLREFVVSPNPNLGVRKDQILNVAVSYTDFSEEEHFVKRLRLDTLEPLTTYYYGITRPQVLANSVTVIGDRGSFNTPAPEGSRMNFTVALGSCGMTGSQHQMFESILELDPLMFIHLGDLHYEDLTTLDVDQRLETYDKVFGSSSQRKLYMRTIFSYMWDDHDWLDNNADGSNIAAGDTAKQGYSLGIPHYTLGPIEKQPWIDEGTAAKYQAFTLGTVRFIILDLRSESRKSTPTYGGKVYSDEQKQWLYNELSRADEYNYVILASTRPWTSPDKVGSDSWGGFVSDRDELSSYIASTVGAGPKNLLVIAGDNHMIAYDDGSSTDYSGQNVNPGGFPLLHSGPLAKFGPGAAKNIFKPKSYMFTEGCMAVSAEINHQFSTIEFVFPQSAAESGCLRIKGYKTDSSSSNVVFEKELCGEIMREGTPEQDSCSTKSFTAPTAAMTIIAFFLIVIYGAISLYYLGLNRWALTLGYFGIGILFYVVTIAASIVGALCLGVKNMNTFVLSILLLCQTVTGFAFVCMAVLRHKKSLEDKTDVGGAGEKVVNGSGEDTVSENGFNERINHDSNAALEDDKAEIELKQDGSGEEVEMVL